MSRSLGPTEFRELYRECAPLVHRRARALLGREAEAWDAVQEVFRRIIESASEFRGEARPMTYLYRATTNVCLNQLRSRALREPGDASEEPGAEEAEEAGEAPELADARELLGKLSKELDSSHQEIFWLHFVDELTQEEVAQVVGLSRKTVGVRLEQIRERARALAGVERLERH